jgi:hypothetical protein
MMVKYSPIGHSIRHVMLGKPTHHGLDFIHFSERRKSRSIKYQDPIKYRKRFLGDKLFERDADQKILELSL